MRQRRGGQEQLIDFSNYYYYARRTRRGKIFQKQLHTYSLCLSIEIGAAAGDDDDDDEGKSNSTK